MSLILFFLGLALLGYGRISVGNIEAEGPTVRGAGVMLMMPLIVRIVMGFVVNVLFVGDDPDAANTAGTFLGLLDIVVMIICAGVAYTLVSDQVPTNIIRMPGNDNDEDKVNKAETKSSTQATKSKPKARPQPRPSSPPPAANRSQKQPTRNRRNFPAVMSTAEAARYLNVSESDVMNLINDGKISAARINYRYRISRDVLDDYLSDEGDTE